MPALIFVAFWLFSAPVHAATVSGILYSSESSLRSVGFDGTNFTSSFSVLQPLLPDWTGMSLLFSHEPPPPIPLPGGALLRVSALACLGSVRRQRPRQAPH